ncbi:uncharacterized protein F5891DRAFT_1179681 [Suillus fuscotomentosus]|uniref:Uncharacterized protein n=1 Tax=Suillus fuscotomentosus TaxID=1912939 RepID=A0AAD4EL95_9AGAM|nr:uncharacterized protein F5891DRAFT_1179681 [Suillus fuscotomentosus]KAG1908162.1 hypothetical protein F5891DRAFT_1179681 [Suillus fuscotomentosus]
MSPGGFYAATPRLAYRTEYFSGGRDGNILITKGLDHNEEFIICSVFQISRDDFCFTPDGNFNPANVFHGRLADLKLSCRLIAGRSKAFEFSSDDFSAVVSNLSAFEKSAPRERSHKTFSVIQDTIGRRSIKLTHCLFEAIDRDQDNNTSDDGSNSSTNASHLQDIVSSHNIRPLPAYDENHILIPPLQYEAKLRGVLVEVHMAFCHTKKSKCDIFDAVLRELIVLLPPVPMPSSPFKRRRLNDGPYTEQYNKGN